MVSYFKAGFTNKTTINSEFKGVEETIEFLELIANTDLKAVSSESVV